MTISLRFELFPDDLDLTVRFYTEALGFRVDHDRRDDADHPYLVLARDAVRIGVTKRAQPASPEDQRARKPPVGVEIVLDVDDLEAELARVRASDWPVLEPLIIRPWGLRDFRVSDPSGYYLRVTERRAAPTDWYPR